MSGLDIALDRLSVRFADTRAVDGVTAHIAANSITGLLGRNGTGKTTLLSVIASLRQPTDGTVLVGGRVPFEDERLMEQICLIRESGDVITDEKVKATLNLVARARPTWDQAYADELLDTFELDPKKKAGKLSRGQRSALGAVIGLASRAPVTMFDEVHLGMDAPSRRKFYEVLIADYVEHPRTIVLSSHLIGEVESLFEHVIILDRGRVVMADEAETLRSLGVTVTGPADIVAAAVADHDVLSERSLGSTTQVTIIGGLDGAARTRFTDAGLQVGSVPIEDLFISLTEKKADS